MLPYRAEVWSGNRCTPEIGSASGRSAQAIHPRVCFRRSPRVLERRWQTGHEASSLRRAEDAASCNVLGASWRHFPFPDCIYRSSPVDGAALYASEEALFGPLHPAEQPLVAELSRLLEEALPAGVQVVVPAGCWRSCRPPADPRGRRSGRRGTASATAVVLC